MADTVGSAGIVSALSESAVSSARTFSQMLPNALLALAARSTHSQIVAINGTRIVLVRAKCGQIRRQVVFERER